MKAIYVNVKKELTKLLLESKMDQYVGIPAGILASELCDYIDKRKHQQQQENSARTSWHWNEGDTNG